MKYIFWGEEKAVSELFLRETRVKGSSQTPHYKRQTPGPQSTGARSWNASSALGLALPC